MQRLLAGLEDKTTGTPKAKVAKYEEQAAEATQGASSPLDEAMNDVMEAEVAAV